MFEKKSEKLASMNVFIRRMLVSLGIAGLLILVVLFIGMSGYHWIGGLDWVDSLLEASMILGGMGPVNPITTTAAKIFASVYALFSGLIFIAIMGIILAPAGHRLLHTFHIDEADQEK
jgi:hypothetical protein